MIVANRNYRPNPDRCIVIDGKIDEQMVTRVTPTLLKLLRTRKPITVYISNSPGGPIDSMEALLRLLNSPHQDSDRLCRIITVVTRKAGSAAADLLCSGDYAIAYPNSIIHYHGGRVYEEDALTKEKTNLLAQYLRWTSDVDAWQLAGKIESRFRLLYLTSRDKFPAIRAQHAPKRMTDFECFIDLIMGKLSDNGKRVCEAARDRYKRYEKLLNQIPRKKKSSRQRRAILEAEQIKVILDFELAANRKNRKWTFRYGGLGRVTEDFHLLTEYIEGKENDRFKLWCSEWGPLALTSAEKVQIDAIENEQARAQRVIDIVRPILEPVWSFFVALCHALQEGENKLTAKDAYWLGLIDEVLGDSDMSALRLLMEYKEDPPPLPPPQQERTGDAPEKIEPEKDKSDSEGS